MTSTTKRFTTIQECRNCDSTASYYNEEDIRVCTLCDCEWDGVDVRVEVGFCHLHQEILLDGESCYTCDDHAETARLLMDMDAASAIEVAEEDGLFASTYKLYDTRTEAVEE